MIFGKTTINKEAAQSMGEKAFKDTFKGLIASDINEAWLLINEQDKLEIVNAQIVEPNKKKKVSFAERLDLEKKKSPTPPTE